VTETNSQVTLPSNDLVYLMPGADTYHLIGGDQAPVCDLVDGPEGGCIRISRDALADSASLCDLCKVRTGRSHDVQHKQICAAIRRMIDIDNPRPSNRFRKDELVQIYQIMAGKEGQVDD